MELQNDINEYIKSNSYPNYDKMMDYIEYSMDLWAEYGEMNHIWCKEIYENPHNKELIISTGRKIYNMGGKQALIKNYKVIALFSPYGMSRSNVIKEQLKIIDECFQEIISLKNSTFSS
jgi:hypothetical protein